MSNLGYTAKAVFLLCARLVRLVSIFVLGENMKKLNLYFFFLLVFLGCNSPRSTIDEARAAFLKKYPNAQIISVRKTLDEVISRDFVVSYRKNANEQIKETQISFIYKDDSVTWEPYIPNELP